jgi:hypothetical protein
MKRGTLNFIIDLFSFVIFIGLITTGFIMKYILPPGSGGRGRMANGGQGGEHIKSLLSMGRHDWGDIHFYLAVVFVILLVLHLFLHFDWIKSYFKRMFTSAGNRS